MQINDQNRIYIRLTFIDYFGNKKIKLKII